MDRFSLEYRLAERIIVLEKALETANDVLIGEGRICVLPQHKAHASKVKALIKKFKEEKKKE